METTWPDCKEVQCQQAHECLETVMKLLGIECDSGIYVVGKTIRISEAIDKLKAENNRLKDCVSHMQIRNALDALR